MRLADFQEVRTFSATATTKIIEIIGERDGKSGLIHRIYSASNPQDRVNLVVQIRDKVQDLHDVAIKLIGKFPQLPILITITGALQNVQHTIDGQGVNGVTLVRDQLSRLLPMIRTRLPNQYKSIIRGRRHEPQIRSKSYKRY